MKKKVKVKPIWLNINPTEIQAPIEREKCLKIFLIHLKTNILLELTKSNTSPTALSNKALSLITLLLVISLNLQLHVAVISVKFIPSYWHPLSHKVALGKIVVILSFNGISFFNLLSKS